MLLWNPPDKLKITHNAVNLAVSLLLSATANTGVNQLKTEVKVSRNGPERRSGKRIIAGTAFRLEFLVGWYYDADATMAVPELY